VKGGDPIQQGGDDADEDGDEEDSGRAQEPHHCLGAVVADDVCWKYRAFLPKLVLLLLLLLLLSSSTHSGGGGLFGFVLVNHEFGVVSLE
jgi:hypothetical protein